MSYGWVTFSIFAFAVVFLLGGLVLCLRKKWVLQWLRGTAGMACIAVSLLLAIAAINVYSYAPILDGRTVLTLSFERQAEQTYLAIVAVSGKEKTEYEFKGDLWQLDARTVKWRGLFERMGLQPGFKLDLLQGRYLSLEQERTSNKTAHQLSRPELLFDWWKYIHTYLPHFPLMAAEYSSAAFLPIADHATFVLSFSSGGLVAKPLNDQAEDALRAWGEY